MGLRVCVLSGKERESVCVCVCVCERKVRFAVTSNHIGIFFYDSASLSLVSSFCHVSSHISYPYFYRSSAQYYSEWLFHGSI